MRRIFLISKDVFNEVKKEGSFARNLAITFSGTTLAQVLGFFFTPFIARIYGPEVYGLFALFISITNNISPIATLQFPSAFVAAKNENEFHNLLRIAFLVLFIFTGIILITTFLFKSEILNYFNAQVLTPYVFFIPIYVFFMGLDNILLGWNIKRKEFTRGAIGKIFSVISSKGLTILWGLSIAPASLGMIVGNLLIYPFEALIKLNRAIRYELSGLFRNVSWLGVRETFWKYRTYPYFLATGAIINNLSNQLPIYYFSVAFGQTDVGYFALASSLVMVPISLVITSSTTVFLQKATEVYQIQPEQLKELVIRLYKRLFFLSVIPLTFFAFLSEWIFVLLFGEEWKQSGVFASFLAVGVIFSVPANPLAVLFRITHHERTNFIINLFFVGIKFTGLMWGVINGNILYSLIGFSLATMVSYSVQLFWIFKIIRLDKTVLYIHFLVVCSLFCLIMLIKL